MNFWISLKAYSTYFILTCLALSSCMLDRGSTKEQNKKTEQKEALYASWRTGKFYYNVRPFGVFLVNRYDTLQEEFIRDNGLLTTFKIAWLNDSMYELRYLEVLENPKSISLPKEIDSLVRICTITNVSDTMYVEKAHSNLSKTDVLTRYRRPKIVPQDSILLQ